MVRRGWVADAEEDRLHGRDQTGEEMPDWVADKKRRAEKIRNAKAELEAEAKAAAEAKLKAATEAQQKREAEGRKKSGRKAAPPATEPNHRDQSRPQARAAIGGLRLLLGGQSRGAGEPQHRWLCGDRPSP